MNKKRIIATAVATTLMAGLTFGSVSGSAQARKDSGWNPVGTVQAGPSVHGKRDSGWNPV